VHFIVLDFDEGNPTFEEIISIIKRFQFSCFLHTTTSHRKIRYDDLGIELPKMDKFRIIIPLTKPISLDEYRNMTEFWKQKFPTIDDTCFHGERFYYVARNAETYLHNSYNEFGEIVFLNPDSIFEKMRNNLGKTSPKRKRTKKKKRRNQ
ncbi:MAG: hypothetical protein ACEPOW_14020, partial [Bacteroidales bacterium]